MKFLLIALIVAPAFGLVIKNQDWHVWKQLHSKTYADEGEERVRFAIWEENMHKITKHNQENHDMKLAMNHFGDLTNDEFRMHMNGYMGKVDYNATSEGSSFLELSNVKVPETVDWRTKGYVAPVQNQEQCGSCWAFSAVASLEGQHFKKTGKLVKLSEQNLVDCSGAYGNHGCQGGLMDNAFRYIKANGGIDTESSYSYRGTDGTCSFKKANVGATDTGFVDIKSGDENALKAATAAIGPISVAIDASHFSFQFYHSGVYNSWLCSSTKLDHGVTVVGYGVYDGKDYWLVKNSWGTTWGIKGYIMMSRNKNNQCGIASKASYPLV
eukprot:gene17638-19393_t